MGDEVSETKRQSTRMAVDTKAPGQAPPDLPSLLLDGRICYIGMPVRACWLVRLPSVCAGMQQISGLMVCAAAATPLPGGCLRAQTVPRCCHAVAHPALLSLSPPCSWCLL